MQIGDKVYTKVRGNTGFNSHDVLIALIEGDVLLATVRFELQTKEHFIFMS